MAVGRRVKAFVAAFLAVFVGCGVADVELWPFSGWHLFSRLRSDRVTTWEVAAVYGNGDERPIPFADLPAAYRGWRQVAAGLAERSQADRAEVCRAWGRAAGDGAVEVRVYAARESVVDPGSRVRELRFRCEAEAAPSG